MQKATIFPNHKEDKFNVKHRRENQFAGSITAFAVYADGKIIEAATLRTYNSSTKATNTACFWASMPNNTRYAHGSGHAGGWGYHRPSAAAQQAINNAGFHLSEEIDGRGESAMETAVKAIAELLHPDATQIFVYTANA